LGLSELQRSILELKEEKNAVLLVHNYQVPEIQEIADYLGDSLQLCRLAQCVEDAELIVFCGVDFMADKLPIDILRKAKDRHPEAPVVLYVNTLAEAKAEATVVCTSSNADRIVAKLGADKVIFGPDRNLAYYVERRVPDVELVVVPDDGYCSVHRFIGSGDEAMELKRQHPGSEVWAHPECEPEFQDRADYVLSTGGMTRRAVESDATVFIVGTEQGLIDRLRREHPHKTFLPAKRYSECAAMKRIDLDNLYEALLKEQHVVTVPEDTADKARDAIERMLQMS
jgi:quinolinate synthase